MVSEEVCEHTELPRDQCAHCRPKQAAEGQPVAAEYHGTCTVCGADIQPGGWIVAVKSGWAHTRCSAVESLAPWPR